MEEALPDISDLFRSQSSSSYVARQKARCLEVRIYNLVLTSLSLEPCTDPDEGQLRILNFIRNKTKRGLIDSCIVTESEKEAFQALVTPAMEEILPGLPKKLLKEIFESEGSDILEGASSLSYQISDTDSSQAAILLVEGDSLSVPIRTQSAVVKYRICSGLEKLIERKVQFKSGNPAAGSESKGKLFQSLENYNLEQHYPNQLRGDMKHEHSLLDDSLGRSDDKHDENNMTDQQNQY